MSKGVRLLILSSAIACLLGCSASHPYATPGALYVQPAGGGPSPWPNEMIVYRDGRVVAHKPIFYVVARDRPDRWLVETNTTGCGGQMGAVTYRLSPNGSRALCSNGEDLRLFDWAHLRSARVVVKKFLENARQTSFGWLDNNRFNALVLDDSCPLAQLYDFFPTRVVTFDLEGRRLSTGPCAFGIITGEHRIALIGERHNGRLFYIWEFFHDDDRYWNDGYHNYHPTWSVDNGKSWHDGEPLAFDGNDRLLYAEPFADVVRSEDGEIVFRNADGVQWSR